MDHDQWCGITEQRGEARRGMGFEGEARGFEETPSQAPGELRDRVDARMEAIRAGWCAGEDCRKECRE